MWANFISKSGSGSMTIQELNTCESSIDDDQEFVFNPSKCFQTREKSFDQRILISLQSSDIWISSIITFVALYLITYSLLYAQYRLKSITICCSNKSYLKLPAKSTLHIAYIWIFIYNEAEHITEIHATLIVDVLAILW